jgi:hypothetical protein
MVARRSSRCFDWFKSRVNSFHYRACSLSRITMPSNPGSFTADFELSWMLGQASPSGEGSGLPRTTLGLLPPIGTSGEGLLLSVQVPGTIERFEYQRLLRCSVQLCVQLISTPLPEGVLLRKFAKSSLGRKLPSPSWKSFWSIIGQKQLEEKDW